MLTGRNEPSTFNVFAFEFSNKLATLISHNKQNFFVNYKRKHQIQTEGQIFMKN